MTEAEKMENQECLDEAFELCIPSFQSHILNKLNNANISIVSRQSSFILKFRRNKICYLVNRMLKAFLNIS